MKGGNDCDILLCMMGRHFSLRRQPAARIVSLCQLLLNQATSLFSPKFGTSHWTPQAGGDICVAVYPIIRPAILDVI